MARILSVSYDVALLNTRQLLLESRGNNVVSAEGFVEAIRHCRAGGFDLLIIGHSIPHSDKAAILDEMKQHWDAPVLALLRTGEPPLEGASDSVDASRPDLLIAAVEQLLPART